MTKEFKEKINDASNRVKNHLAENKARITNETMTVTILIEPVIQTLGYDTTDPTQFVKEYSPDKRGTNRGRVDCTLLGDNEEPIMVIECKHWDKELIKHERQLFEYHGSSNARLGVLTNGILYRFYADLDRPNIMDEKPFFEFDITKPDDEQIEVLKKFSKSNFNIDVIIETAQEMKSISDIKGGHRRLDGESARMVCKRNCQGGSSRKIDFHKSCI